MLRDIQTKLSQFATCCTYHEGGGALLLTRLNNWTKYDWENQQEPDIVGLPLLLATQIKQKRGGRNYVIHFLVLNSPHIKKNASFIPSWH